MSSKSLVILSLFVVFFLLISCEGDIGPSGIDSLINTTDEPAGANCAAGGLKVDIGLDTNRNGVLDTDEIKSTHYICGGNVGQSTLIKTTVESAGENCSAGGIKIESGIDLNKNGTLEQNEVQSTQFVCNGIDGLSSLVNTSLVAAGTECSNGGLRLDVGTDTNRDGVLDESEIQSTRFICNGTNGVSVDQVRFQLVSLSELSSSSTMGDLAPAWQYLRKFKRSDFGSMQSAILSAYVSTEGGVASTCTVELFNLTDNEVIAGSEVQTSSETLVWVDSENFLNNIPDKEIDLAIRIRTSVEGGFANCIQAHLILSRNNDGLVIGQSYGGGIIFYLDVTRQHGLIAAPHDQSSAMWSETYSITNATGITVGTGQENTAAIVEALGTGNYAAKVCDDLELGGYNDWFLPSRDELNQLYLKRNAVGNFTSEYYWSSTESASETAWGQLFDNGHTNGSLAKSGNLLSVRAVRAF